MEVMTTLYYEDLSLPDQHIFHLLGRALTREEYKNITAHELRNALCNSPLFGSPATARLARARSLRSLPTN